MIIALVWYLQKKNADGCLHSFTKLKTKLKFMLDYEFSEIFRSSNDTIALGFFALTILLLFD